MKPATRTTYSTGNGSVFSVDIYAYACSKLFDASPRWQPTVAMEFEQDRIT
jgi:hypothetical protein